MCVERQQREAVVMEGIEVPCLYRVDVRCHQLVKLVKS